MRAMVSTAIVTRNAVHGGVETMIALHQVFFDATVFVAGGINKARTCPFHYTYVDAREPAAAQARLTRLLRKDDGILYHWLPPWAQEGGPGAGQPWIEV